MINFIKFILSLFMIEIIRWENIEAIEIVLLVKLSFNQKLIIIQVFIEFSTFILKLTAPITIVHIIIIIN
jgi:hypothetical protein